MRAKIANHLEIQKEGLGSAGYINANISLTVNQITGEMAELVRITPDH